MLLLLLAGAGCHQPVDCVETCEAPTRAVSITQVGWSQCALLDNGTLRCWGYNEGGVLGYPGEDQIGDDENPAAVGPVQVGTAVEAVRTGGWHTCAITVDGALRCWGYGEHGQLGYGNTEAIGDDEHPEAAGDVDVGGVVDEVAVGGNHTCVLLAGGSVRCFGLAGMLGVSATENIGDNESPATAPTVKLAEPAVQVVAGRNHTCALLGSGAVQCWGRGGPAMGYPGIPTVGEQGATRIDEAGLVDVGGPVAKLAASSSHTCAILYSGQLRCWGLADDGALGYGNLESIGDDEHPATAGDVPLGGATVVEVDMETHTCAVLEGGSVRCWGRDHGSGRLGLGYITDVIGDDELPTDVDPIQVGGPAIGISVGLDDSCVLLETGSVRCWGASGSLGYGTFDHIGDDEHPASAGDIELF